MKGVKTILDFLHSLTANNDREWFQAHRSQYLEAMQARDEITMALIDRVAGYNPKAVMLSEKDCVYRIYRDTRFSPDKTPFKTHVGIFINPPYGKKSIMCGYYFHLEPDNCFAAAGTIGWEAPVIRAVRQSIFDNIDEYRDIVESGSFRECYPHLGDDFLKTAPKGFPKDWEYIDYIRPRAYVASSGNIESLFLSGDVCDFDQYIREATRYNRFINFTLKEIAAGG